MVFVAPTFVLITCRVWLLYFDLKFGEAILAYSWWETVVNDHRNWWIQNKRTYGSFKRYIYKRVIIFISIWWLIICLGAYYLPTMYLLSVTIIPDSFWCFMVYLFCKMPKHYDVFYIRKEINRLVIFYIFPTAWYAVTRGGEIDSKYLIISWISGYLIVPISCAITAIITLLPYYENKTIRRQASVMAQIKENSTSNMDTCPYYGNLWVLYVNSCDDDNHWNQFMQHLIREIAVENLCFVLECIQFKQQLIKKFYPDYKAQKSKSDKVDDNVNKDEDDDQKIGWIIPLPPCLPSCSIITDNIDRPRAQIYEIYMKYIHDDARLLVNISYESRSKFIHDIDHKFGIIQEWNKVDRHRDRIQSPSAPEEVGANNANGDGTDDRELLKIFDSLLCDVCENLNGAFYRFQSREKMDDNKMAMDLEGFSNANRQV